MRYVVAAGGTGGHIIPALNIVDALAKLDSDAKFLFVGSERGMEKDIIPVRGYDLTLVKSEPWHGAFGSLKMVVSTSGEVKAIAKKFDAQVALGTGGYVAAPLSIAAWRAGIPLFWQEQNTYPGLATRLASLFAKKMFLGFPDAKKHLWKKNNAVFSGNPVSTVSILETREQLRQKLGLNANDKVIFVTGGSQGAKPLNDILIDMLEKFELPTNFQIIWQCGSRDFEKIAHLPQAQKPNVRVHGFVTNMAEIYAASDIAFCRAGAATLAEIAQFALPAILVPFPQAAADHQTKNAQSFAAVNAALMIPQSTLTGEKLLHIFTETLSDEKKIAFMREQMRKLAKPDAANFIAQEIFGILSKTYKYK